MNTKKPPQPVHISGTARGEEAGFHKEPGRGTGKQYRDARDSTGISAEHRRPIDPSMPNIPPA